MTDITDRIQSIRQHPAVRTGTTVLWILFIVPLLIYSFPMVVGADGGFVVLSGSMEPAISPGDVVIVNEVKPEAIDQGDVITFRRSGESIPTTHRVIEVKETDGGVQFVTKGDNNEAPDHTSVRGEQVAGRVPDLDIPGYGTLLFVIPYMGHVIQILGTSHGFFLLFVLPFVTLLGAEVWSFARTTAGKESGGAGESDGDGDRDGSTAEEARLPGAAEPDGTQVGAVDGAGSGADISAAGDAGSEEGPGTYTFTVSELRLAIIVLGVFLVYSLFVARELLTLWSIMIAAGVSMATLLICTIYLFAGTVGEEGSTAGDSPGGGDGHPDQGVASSDARGDGSVRPVPGPIPPESELDTTVRVDSLDGLVDVALAKGREIVREGDTHAVIAGGVAYLHVDETGAPPDEFASEQETPRQDSPGQPPTASAGESGAMQLNSDKGMNEIMQKSDTTNPEESKTDDD